MAWATYRSPLCMGSTTLTDGSAAPIAVPGSRRSASAGRSDDSVQAVGAGVADQRAEARTALVQARVNDVQLVARAAGHQEVLDVVHLRLRDHRLEVAITGHHEPL